MEKSERSDSPNSRETSQFSKGQYNDDCVPCPNKCEVENIPREDMDEHEKTCLSAIVHCDYHAMGCDCSVFRRDLEKHNKEYVNEHLSLTRNLLDKTAQNYQNLEKRHAEFVEQTNSAIAYLEEKMQQITSQNGMAEYRINELEKELQSLKQKEGSPQRDSWLSVSWDDNVDVQAVTGVNDDSIPVLPVYVKMSNFDKHRRSRERWYSDPFYSHKKGYKMCLHVKASGLGANLRDRSVSVLIHLMQGPYDDELPWPITKTYNIKLLNQISNTDHWVREACFATAWYEPIAERVTGDRETSIYGRGSFDFIPIKRIGKIKPKCQYLKDDSIIFFIEVSPWDSLFYDNYVL